MWISESELLENPGPPEYVAVSVRSPTLTSVRSQLPTPPLNVPAQVAVPPLTLTVTLPVGVPRPEVTWKLTVKVEPLTDGSGSSDVMAVVVAAGGGGGAAATVCDSVSELPESPGSPA